jgi:hypothetical protein
VPQLINTPAIPERFFDGHVFSKSEAWTHWELAMTANRDGITSAISRSTVGRILAEANIKPHRSKYWEIPNIKDNLGPKGKDGILKNLEIRENFLSDKSHRSRFVYTPKHCSWLNQIEIWFGILTRKILRHGSFKSIDDLRERIESFIEYYNQTMAKVFKWTYKGKLLQA